MKQETIEEIAENFWLNDNSMSDNDRISYVNGFLTCAKWQQENSYSEEDMKDAYIQGTLGLEYKKNFNESFYKWFKQFKKK
jgi:hypothetical protein